MYEGKILGLKEEGLSEPPIAVIGKEDFDLIFGYVLSHPYEIHGRGFVYPNENILNIKDVFILPQKTGLGFVDEKEGAIHKYVAENIRNGFDFGKMNFQWHSHPDEVYFSSKDRSSARKWGKTMNFVLSLVVNKRFEYVCRLDVFKPVPLSIQIPLIVTHKIKAETMQFCQDEIAKKVTVDHTYVEKVRMAIGGKREEPSIKDVAVVPLDKMLIQE